ncbi:MAG TPA: Crp/Fnr family transcriptional regulator [Bacteroidales bacterium]|nr:Crp/Fnr family transcriptional regulator [Bacteroidales bacterium]
MNYNCSFCEYKSTAASKLEKHEIEKLGANCLSVKFKKGDTIIRQGTYSTNVAYLKKGVVKIHIEGPYHTQVVRIVKPRNYLGLPTTFGDKINQYSVSAIEESEVCFIDITVFRALLHSNPDFSNQILIELCRGELESYQKCVNRTQKQVRGKVADVILDFADNIYQNDSFLLNITQEDIGNLVDATRESVSRVWAEFIKDEIISVDGKQVSIVNKEALRNMSRLG